ncbi:Na+/H+ antiporter NhaA [Zhihengliuella sp.]|uniref:Na+/H+ antiporter NhaA n=1 Tax=Zhihengliuella sp. TaxID=1954483 RepID=UPI0028124C05|nr:Na+/H+ antiporter NhaA [Zhihengliuella sp.]
MANKPGPETTDGPPGAAPQEQTRPLIGWGSYSESRRIGEILRKETVGGMMLVAAAAIAIIWANTPAADAYFALRDFHFAVGPESWHLDLSLGHWASDGLLAIFFFLVGLELKKEIVAGDLRTPSKAMVPVMAAVGGVVIPAGIYALINMGSPTALHGWAIPTATDIAFAVAVLAIIGSHLPSPLRIFLLTLAVVDDLIAILIIAVFYTDEINFLPLALFVLPVLVYAVLTQKFRHFFGTRHWAPWVILLPLGLVAWAFLHASGIHATIAGVVLGFVVPVIISKEGQAKGAKHGLAEDLEHHLRPLSSGVAVPIFAFFSAGVAIGGAEGFASALTDPVTIGVVAGLVLGKPIGILLTTWCMAKFTRAQLDASIRWIDLFGVGLLAGIGFTVSLLVAELSFGIESEHNDHAKVAILSASILAALLAAAILGVRNRHYKRIEEEASVDANADGIPDVYEDDSNKR